jgi:hypothetical protein
VDFLLFLLLNFTLFVRPADFMPGYEDLSLYNYVLLATLAVAWPKIANYLFSGQAFRDPITACVVGLIPAIALSNLSHFDLWGARMNAWEFTKVVIYYLTLVSVVNSTERLRSFLYSIALFAAATSAIAVLDHFDVIDIPTLHAVQEGVFDPVTGETTTIPRLRATGIFADPNDLSMLCVFSMVICTMGLTDQSQGMFRFAWLAPFGLLCLTLVLTKSRGGILSLIAAAGVLSYYRFGLWKTAALALVCAPALLLAGGRQVDLGNGMSGGTGQARIELWYCGLVAMRQSPLFGIGYGNYTEECVQVAHNSFVHSFVELGLFGGALFLGAFWLSALSLWKLGHGSNASLQIFTTGSFQRLQPFVLAGVLGFAVSQFSISRTYVIPTYFIFGSANVYALEAQRQGLPPAIDLNGRRLGELLLAGIAFLILIYLFIRLTIH